MLSRIGNVSPIGIGYKLGIKLSEEDLRFLEDTYQEDAGQKIEPQKWHCYSLPFEIMAGSMETAKEIYDRIRKYPVVDELLIRY